MAWVLVAVAVLLTGDGGSVARARRRRPGMRRAGSAEPDTAESSTAESSTVEAGTVEAGTVEAGTVEARRRERWLPGAAAASAAVVCVAGVGWPIGALVAAVAGPVAGRCIGILLRRAQAEAPDESLPLALDLAASALRAGQTVADALALAAPAAGTVATPLRRVAVLLRLGSDPADAWQVVADGALAPVARIAVRSANSGVRLAAAFEAHAADLRREVQAAMQQRAQRAGVAALAPLGLCFLPAFVCLGIVPVIVGIARTALVGLP
jgi:Flp pilus assembly protein TadB